MQKESAIVQTVSAQFEMQAAARRIRMLACDLLVVKELTDRYANLIFDSLEIFFEGAQNEQRCDHCLSECLLT